MKTTQQTKSTAHYRQGRDFRQLALAPRLWRFIPLKIEFVQHRRYCGGLK